MAAAGGYGPSSAWGWVVGDEAAEASAVVVEVAEDLAGSAAAGSAEAVVLVVAAQAAVGDDCEVF